MIKNLTLLLIIAGSIWLLKPPAGKSAAPKKDAPTAKYVLHVFSGVYTPGTMPHDVGQPLRAIRDVADRFEALYPDTKIEFVNVPSNQREWLVTQLSAGQAPDILCVNVEDVWQDVHKGWYIALDDWLDKPNPFVKPGSAGSKVWWDLFKYPSITRGTAAPDGRMYCIPFDMVETGIFYNKDLFELYGLQEPQTWNEFIHVQRVLKEHDHIPLMVAMPLISDWAVDLLFDQLYYEVTPLIDLRKEGKRAAYLEHYLDWDEIAFLHSRGFFTKDDPRWMEMWRILKQWRSFFSRNLSRTDAEVLRSFMTQKAGMLWTSSTIVNLFSRDPNMAFEWGVFYLPGLGPEVSSFAQGDHGMCVIGGSATQFSVTNSAFSDTHDPSTSIRLQRSITFLQMLTAPESAGAVINEMPCFLPNIAGVEPQKALLPFEAFLRRHYASSKWSYTFDLRFSDIMDRMLELYLNDGVNEVEFADWMQRNLNSAIENIEVRKKIDYSELERTWNHRSDMRQQMKGLPDAAR
jgi:ABC-type glycerol-3-phosphate transport system substrate-binding protein